MHYRLKLVTPHQAIDLRVYVPCKVQIIEIFQQNLPINDLSCSAGASGIGPCLDLAPDMMQVALLLPACEEQFVC